MDPLREIGAEDAVHPAGGSIHAAPADPADCGSAEDPAVVQRAVDAGGGALAADRRADPGTDSGAPDASRTADSDAPRRGPDSGARPAAPDTCATADSGATGTGTHSRARPA